MRERRSKSARDAIRTERPSQIVTKQGFTLALLGVPTTGWSGEAGHTIGPLGGIRGPLCNLRMRHRCHDRTAKCV